MIVIVAADIHASPRHLATTLLRAEEHGADATVFNGDIIPKSLYSGMNARKAVIVQRDYLAGDFLSQLTSYKRKHADTKLYADFGNDDFWCNRDILMQAERDGILMSLHGRVQPLTTDIDIAGYMYVPPTPFIIKDAERIDRTGVPMSRDVTLKGIFSAPDGSLREDYIDGQKTIELDMQELRRQLKRPFILATHAPPYGLGLDVIYDGRPVGSMAIRAFIEHEADSGRLIAAFSGHIHESFETSGIFAREVSGRPIVNAGQMQNRLRYALFDTITGKVTIKTSPLIGPL